MCSKRIVIFLVLVFCLCDLGDGANSGKMKKLKLNKQAMKDPADIRVFPKNYFQDVLELITQSKLYNILQEVLVHYVQHFLFYEKMTMKTKTGRITVPLNSNIKNNVSLMVQHILHIENCNVALKNKSFEFANLVNQFRFIRNNSVILDQIVEHANASFRYHKEIENPEKIKIYNTLKTNEKLNLLKTEYFHKSMDYLINKQKLISTKFTDIANGKLSIKRSHDLNSEECLDIAKYASEKNLKQGIQFYEAAVRRINDYDSVILNKTQVLQEVIQFYQTYSDVCSKRVSKLRELQEKILTENTNDYDDEEDNENVEEETYENDAEELGVDTNEAQANARNGNSIKNTETADGKNGPKDKKEVDRSTDENKGDMEDEDLEEKLDNEDVTCIIEIMERFSAKSHLKHDEL